MKHNIEPKPLFIERMHELLEKEEDFENYMKVLKEEPVRSIRCNTLKISPEKLKTRLEKKRWKIQIPFKDYPEILIVKGKFADENLEDEVDNEPKTKLNSTSKNYLIKTSKVSDEGTNTVRGGGLGRGGLNSKQNDANLKELEPGELGRALEHVLGYYYIQEIASMLPVLALKPLPGDFVFDMCAAPGSKTTQISASMENKGVVIANEVSLGRIKILASNLERCGVTNAMITKKDGVLLLKKFEKLGYAFNKILVDAPCSGEGTLRSSPKTYRMWNIHTIRKLSKIQRNLISTAIELLAPGGEMIYSTCTHAPEENEEIVDFALKKFSNIKIEKINLPITPRPGLTKWQDKEYLEDVKYACRIYPQDNNTEGFFIAKFKKTK